MEPSENKARILCLHGYRQCAKTFKEKLGAFRKLLKHEAEFVFVDSPHVLSSNSDERSWWFTSNDMIFSSEHVTDVCIGFKESIEKIRTVFSRDGPFDGLLGFSQGAALAAILCSGFNSHELKFSFVILVAGFKSLVCSHSQFYENTLDLPSLHVIGKCDTVINKKLSEELSYCFRTCEKLYHEGGHFVPANKQLKHCYSSFIHKFCTPNSG